MYEATDIFRGSRRSYWAAHTRNFSLGWFNVMTAIEMPHHCDERSHRDPRWLRALEDRL
ncbi:hypothetical protein AA14337_1002 [Acetobacter malorum DSM 14337]|uniref:Uncharacterized protein n=1 Tax=Acetobacter malorum DSM 14337 TaxID=1307910 RepID=A0ABQ0PQ79_9PROT|nr:hypothetical protein AA14337_1002 [Acetobacter malorum DSM 14337]